MREWMKIVENVDQQAFAALAAKYENVEDFIRATDGEDVLYRGHHDEATPNHAFMTDYVGHAGEYAGDEGRIDAFAYDRNDVLFFNDMQFDYMRFVYMRMDEEDLAKEYQIAISGNRHAGEFDAAVHAIYDIMQGEVPYSTICGDPSVNDPLIPLLQHYAATRKGKNIIAFHGSDYAAYGGQTEYVVGDVSKLLDLRKLHARCHGALTENWFHTAKYADTTYDIFKNPSRQQVMSMIQADQYKQVRAICTPEDVYVFSADMSHGEVQSELGWGLWDKARIFIDRQGPYINQEDDMAQVGTDQDYDKEEDKAHNAAQLKMVRDWCTDHPVLKRWFPGYTLSFR